MTKGNPFALLFGFAFSLMIGNVFQQLYTFVDTMIVGKYLGMTALAALGATEWPVFVMFGCVQGITQGFSISMAKRFGSRDEEELKKDMGGSILLCLVLSVVFTTVGVILCKPILNLLHTPQDMMGMADLYLRTLYGGVCISFCYNMLAAFLRAAGDSRTPLAAVFLAAVCNIVLDYIFVVILQLGVFGAACVLGVMTSAVMSFVMLTFGGPILSCFLSGEEKVLAQTLEIGGAFLKILASFFWLLYLLYILRACVQGMGNTLLPMCSSFLQLFMRVGCAFFLTKKIGQTGVFWGEVCAWLLADLFLCVCLAWVYRRQSVSTG